MPKTIYPDTYSNEDKAIYDDLMSRGETLIGKKLSQNERFILDIAAKITINEMKGINSGFTSEEIEEMKKTHKQMAQAGVIQTPPDSFYDDMIKLSNGTTFKHPLSYPAEYYYEQNKTAPDDPDDPDVIAEDDTDNYIANQVDKMLGVD